MVKKALESLDEKIFRLHGKFVEKANKTVGWDKWDCAHKANTAAGGSWVGGMVYGFIASVNTQDQQGMLFYGASALLGILTWKVGKDTLHLRERNEGWQIESGRMYAPLSKSSRPLNYLKCGVVLGIGYLLVGGVVPDVPIEYSEPAKLGIAAITGHYVLKPSVSYFQDQIPAPRNKDTVYSRLKDKIKRWFGQKEPVAVGADYSVEDLLDG